MTTAMKADSPECASCGCYGGPVSFCGGCAIPDLISITWSYGVGGGAGSSVTQALTFNSTRASYLTDFFFAPGRTWDGYGLGSFRSIDGTYHARMEVACVGAGLRVYWLTSRSAVSTCYPRDPSAPFSFCDLGDNYSNEVDLLTFAESCDPFHLRGCYREGSGDPCTPASGLRYEYFDITAA